MQNQNQLQVQLRHQVSRAIAKVTETVLPDEFVTRMRTARDWERWVDALTPETLDNLAQAPFQTQQQIFKANVRLVEIETHARCNRVCSFCPNILVDRRRNKTITSAEMLDRVFDELGSIDFTGQIKVARYSEPLADLDCLYARIASARARVPHAQIAIVTNTDYLTSAVLDKLEGLGLDVVYMSLYLKSNETWSAELARSYNERIAAKLGANVTSKRETPVSVHWTFQYRGLDLRSSCMNWGPYGIDRGASMQQFATEQRVGPCRAPFDTFVIDYDGSVVPCCNIRSDLPSHQKMIAGNLSTPEASIFSIYAGRLSAWRRSMVGFGAKAYPCVTCRHLDIPESVAEPIALRLEKRLADIQRIELYQSPKETGTQRK